MESHSTQLELDAESIVVKIRWFGLVLGYLAVNLLSDASHRLALNAILALGAAFALVDSLYSLRGRVFLGRTPLIVSAMESAFIGLLCYFDGGLNSAFRFYYLLSLICTAVRQSARMTYATWALHSASVVILNLALPAEQRQPSAFVFTLVLLAWVTWAANSLAELLKKTGLKLVQMNETLNMHQSQLEAHIAERTDELREAQVQLLHREKMAAFGLLAAGIAHEVGNPLTSISSIVQLIERREHDSYTNEKLALVSDQLRRIQGILRELIDFSRPASAERTLLTPAEIVEEALSIAKYYKGMKNRSIAIDVPTDLPKLTGVRGQLVSVILNLVLNAIDATNKGGRIAITACRVATGLTLSVRDDGQGIAEEYRAKLFQPYFTTKAHGTGLGLYMARKLLHQHGATIHCESKPGQGTTFVIQFRLQPAATSSE